MQQNHLSAIERGNIEVLHKQEKSQSEISQALCRNRSTISRELKRGTATQMKNQNEKSIYFKEYFAKTR
ncbi:helix-turn-helix domain-containing protein [Granulicatella sp.]